jgi:hypothetical protein
MPEGRSGVGLQLDCCDNLKLRQKRKTAPMQLGAIGVGASTLEFHGVCWGDHNGLARVLQFGSPQGARCLLNEIDVMGSAKFH